MGNNLQILFVKIYINFKEKISKIVNGITSFSLNFKCIYKKRLDERMQTMCFRHGTQSKY